MVCLHWCCVLERAPGRGGVGCGSLALPAPRDVGQAVARPGHFPPWRRHRPVARTAHPAGADSL